MTASLAEWVAKNNVELSTLELAALSHTWDFWARPEQLPPTGNWITWLILAGRGFGKTRSGAEWVRAEVEAGVMRIALVGPTASDVRDVMVEGESGLLAVFPPHQTPKYEPSKRRVTFHTGARAYLYSSEKPGRLRGPQHEIAWCDEPGAWKYRDETYSNLKFGLRLGPRPRMVLTTTPLPIPFFRDLVKAADEGKPVVVTRGKTTDNVANLPEAFIADVVEAYGGTRLGRQELDGELLDAWAGALWQQGWIHRIPSASDVEEERFSIDPAISTTRKSDETGLVHCGAMAGKPRRFVVTNDLSGKWTTTQWTLLAAAQHFTALQRGQRCKVVAEVNRGGDMVRDALLTFDARTFEPIDDAIERVGEHRYRLIEQRSEKRREPTILVVDLSHVSRRFVANDLDLVHGFKGKSNRAELIAALYEQGRGFHAGTFEELERQMTTWDPTTDPQSPDRLDALVWGARSLGFAIEPRKAPSLSANITAGTRRAA